MQLVKVERDKHTVEYSNGDNVIMVMVIVVMVMVDELTMKPA